MGYAICFSTCFGCERVFGFNPNFVPSIRWPSPSSERRPVCLDCIEAANKRREAVGLPPHVIHPQAYEPINEEDL